MSQVQTENARLQTDRESARLAALESLAILDTPPEPGYDAITRLAADYFEAETAIISFADETRLWIKSHFGKVLRELPRDNTIFDLVLAADAPLIIPDIREHPDFQGQKYYLHSRGVRFLAAAPIRTARDSIVGMLAIYCKQTRGHLLDNELRTLVNLATMVSSQLELHKLRIEAKRRPGRHSRPHQNISTEFHTPQGPCVFVPLPANRCSVVWVTEPKEAERLMALSDAELSESVETRSHSILGKLQVEPGRHLFPLAIEQSRQFASKRIALVGEAAHVLPPIGAQGLNLGLRDAADIAEVVRNASVSGEDPGSPPVLNRYALARRPDIMSRTFAIDVANRSLLSAFLPMQSLRAAGLHLIGSFGPLRRLAMREGLAPSWRSSATTHAADEATPHN